MRSSTDNVHRTDVFDLATDARGGNTTFHLIVEGAVIAVGSVATVRLAQGVRRLARDARELREQAKTLALKLDSSRLEAARWRRDARNLIEGLGAAIDKQFEAWGLSPAEQEIAQLLKDLSHKEIALLAPRPVVSADPPVTRSVG